jgi:acetoin:2,6-dichlorophenolindophenol oxidoreductase subunit beta
MSSPRKLQYSLAINEALHQMMATDETVFLIGQGVKSPWYVGNTTQGLLDRFGEDRVIDTPISENSITGAAVGSAIAGMKAIVIHPRMDFMFFAMDPIVNQAANWHYMNGGKASVPVVFWGIINRYGEQAAQHSQAIHGLFANIPGLKVVMPATAYDAKGLMIESIQDPNPIVFVDERLLYRVEDPVPEDIYTVEIGKGAIRKEGKDATIIAVSIMVHEAVKAAEILELEGVDVEVIDLRTIKPLDEEMILKSVRKTGRAIIVDVGWKSFGVSAEVAALIAEKAFYDLRSPIARVALPDCPAPASKNLEESYYPAAKDIINAVKKLAK